MSLPISSSMRMCTSCPASIFQGDKFALDPDGDVICEDCIPADFDYDQYEDEDDRYSWEDYTWSEDWQGDDE